jgi:hypothetical protein
MIIADTKIPKKTLFYKGLVFHEGDECWPASEMEV